MKRFSNTMSKASFTHEIDLDGEGVIDLEVTFSKSPFTPETWDSPAEGGEVEDMEVKFRGKDFTPFLNQKELSQIEQACYNYEIETEY